MKCDMITNAFAGRSMGILKLTVLSFVCVALSGCLVGAAVNAVGETAEAAIELTGATVKATAGATGAVIGGTVDAVIPGDQRKSDED